MPAGDPYEELATEEGVAGAAARRAGRVAHQSGETYGQYQDRAGAQIKAEQDARADELDSRSIAHYRDPYGDPVAMRDKAGEPLYKFDKSPAVYDKKGKAYGVDYDPSGQPKVVDPFDGLTQTPFALRKGTPWQRQQSAASKDKDIASETAKTVRDYATNAGRQLKDFEAAQATDEGALPQEQAELAELRDRTIPKLRSAAKPGMFESFFGAEESDEKFLAKQAELDAATKRANDLEGRITTRTTRMQQTAPRIEAARVEAEQAQKLEMAQRESDLNASRQKLSDAGLISARTMAPSAFGDSKLSEQRQNELLAAHDAPTAAQHGIAEETFAKENGVGAAKWTLPPEQRKPTVYPPTAVTNGDLDSRAFMTRVHGEAVASDQPATVVAQQAIDEAQKTGVVSVGGVPLKDLKQQLAMPSPPEDDFGKNARTVQNAEAKKPDKPFFKTSDVLSGIWDAVSGLGPSAKAAYYQLTEGLDRPDTYSPEAQVAMAEGRKRNEEMEAKTKANQAAGTSSSVGESFREAGGSLGFSLGSMAAALPAAWAGGEAGAAIGAAVGAPAAGVGAIPGAGIGATIGAGAAGFLASGTAAYRMAGATFLSEAFAKLETISQQKNGRPMSEEEKKAAYDELLPVAKNTAAWEAGPEALGNMVSLGAGKIVLGIGKPLVKGIAKSIYKKMAVKAGALVGATGTELATEAATQVEQGADDRKLQAYIEGRPMSGEKADWSAKGIGQAFKEVTPQTLALLGLMGGGGAVAVKAGQALDAGVQAHINKQLLRESQGDAESYTALSKQFDDLRKVQSGLMPASEYNVNYGAKLKTEAHVLDAMRRLDRVLGAASKDVIGSSPEFVDIVVGQSGLTPEQQTNAKELAGTHGPLAPAFVEIGRRARDAGVMPIASPVADKTDRITGFRGEAATDHAVGASIAAGAMSDLVQGKEISEEMGKLLKKTGLAVEAQELDEAGQPVMEGKQPKLVLKLHSDAVPFLPKTLREGIANQKATSPGTLAKAYTGLFDADSDGKIATKLTEEGRRRLAINAGNIDDEIKKLFEDNKDAEPPVAPEPPKEPPGPPGEPPPVPGAGEEEEEKKDEEPEPPKGPPPVPGADEEEEKDDGEKPEPPDVPGADEEEKKDEEPEPPKGPPPVPGAEEEEYEFEPHIQEKINAITGHMGLGELDEAERLLNELAEDENNFIHDPKTDRDLKHNHKLTTTIGELDRQITEMQMREEEKKKEPPEPPKKERTPEEDEAAQLLHGAIAENVARFKRLNMGPEHIVETDLGEEHSGLEAKEDGTIHFDLKRLAESLAAARRGVKNFDAKGWLQAALAEEVFHLADFAVSGSRAEFLATHAEMWDELVREYPEAAERVRKAYPDITGELDETMKAQLAGEYLRMIWQQKENLPVTEGFHRQIKKVLEFLKEIVAKLAKGEAPAIRQALEHLEKIEAKLAGEKEAKEEGEEEELVRLPNESLPKGVPLLEIRLRQKDGKWQHFTGTNIHQMGYGSPWEHSGSGTREEAIRDAVSQVRRFIASARKANDVKDADLKRLDKIEAALDKVDPAKQAPEPERPEPVEGESPTRKPIVRKPHGVTNSQMEEAEQVDAINGKTGVLKLPDGTEIPYTMQLVDSRLVVDNPDNERPGPTHPDTVKFVAAGSGAKYNAEKAFVPDPDFQKGTPMVFFYDGRFVLLGGHRRTYLYRANQKAYEAELPKHAADRYGINPFFIEGRTHPYVVAVIDEVLTKEQHTKLIRALNTSDQQEVNPTFDAVSAGRQLSEESVKTAGLLFDENEEATPLKLLQAAASKDLAAAFLKDGAIRAQDRQKYITDSGAFTDEGARFARTALLGRVIDDPQTLEWLEGGKTERKLINGLGVLYALAKRGQDMTLFTQMLELEASRINEGVHDNVKDWQAELDSDFLRERNPRAEALQRWFDTFTSRDAKKRFSNLIATYRPETAAGQVDIFQGENRDVGEGLLEDEGKGLSLPASKPGAENSPFGDEAIRKAELRKIYKALAKKTPDKLTMAEHDRMVEIEKDMGQGFWVDPTQLAREEKLPKTKANALRTELSKLMKAMGGSKAIAKASEELRLGDYKAAEKTLRDAGNFAQADAVKAELLTKQKRIKPHIDQMSLLASKPEGPSLFDDEEPDRPPKYKWTEGKTEDGVRTWTAPSKLGPFIISETVPGSQYALRLAPKSGQPDVIFNAEKSLVAAQRFIEHNFPAHAPEAEDQETTRTHRPSTPLTGGVAEGGDQGELRFTGTGQLHPRKPSLNLLTSRTRWTQRSPVEYLPAWLKAVLRPHQQQGANLALHGFDGGQNFLLADGTGAGKTMQELAVGATMALKPVPLQWEGWDDDRGTKASKDGKWLIHRAKGGGTGFLLVDRTVIEDKKKGGSKGLQDTFGVDSEAEAKAKATALAVERGETPRGHRVLIVTQNAQIIQNAFGKDAKTLGMTSDDSIVRAYAYGNDKPEPERVYIATYYDILSDKVQAGDWDVVIFDEAHNLRNIHSANPESISRKADKVARSAKHVMYATATPIDKVEQLAYLHSVLPGGGDMQQIFAQFGLQVETINNKDGSQTVLYRISDALTDAEVDQRMERLWEELTRRGRMIKREVPMTNIDINFKEVDISDADYIHAEDLYQSIYREQKAKGNELYAHGIAANVARGYLEQAKVPAALEEVEKGLKAGKQVIVFADRIAEGKEGTYNEGIDGTIEKMIEALERTHGKGSVGRLFGGTGKMKTSKESQLKWVAAFQRGEVKILVATPQSGGTGINLDDVWGDKPRKMVMLTPPYSSLTFVQMAGRINRLTTASRGEVAALFTDHPIDTWGLDISNKKLRTLGAAVTGDITLIKPLELRKEELQLNDDASLLVEAMLENDKLRETFGIRRALGRGISATRRPTIEEARAILRDPRTKELAQKSADDLRAKMWRDEQARWNQMTTSPRKLDEYARDPQLFSNLSPQHARLGAALDMFVREGSLLEDHAQLLRAVLAQSTGKTLSQVKFEAFEGKSALGLGGRGYLGLKKGMTGNKGVLGTISMDPAKVFLHEWGHVGYFTLLSATERRIVNRAYAKIGGRSGAGEWFRSAYGTDRDMAQQRRLSNQRYFSKNVWEFFAEGFAQYVMERRVPEPTLVRVYRMMERFFLKFFKMLRLRKESGLSAIYDKIMELNPEAKNINYAAEARRSLIAASPMRGRDLEVKPEGKRFRIYIKGTDESIGKPFATQAEAEKRVKDLTLNDGKLARYYKRRGQDVKPTERATIGKRLFDIGEPGEDYILSQFKDMPLRGASKTNAEGKELIVHKKGDKWMASLVLKGKAIETTKPVDTWQEAMEAVPDEWRDNLPQDVQPSVRIGTKWVPLDEAAELKEFKEKRQFQADLPEVPVTHRDEEGNNLGMAASRPDSKAEKRLKALRLIESKRALTATEQAERDELDREVGQNFFEFAKPMTPEEVAAAKKKEDAAKIQEGLKKKLQGGQIETQPDLLGPSTDKSGNLTMFASRPEFFDEDFGRGREAAQVESFRSGANTDQLVDAYRNVGEAIGTELQDLNAKREKKLVDYVNQGGQVFVDSGAFKAFQQGRKVDFGEVMERYAKLADAVKPEARGRLNLVMPDVVGNQGETLALIGTHKVAIQKLIHQGVRAILPMQRGEKSLGEMWKEYGTTLGTQNFAPGIPSRAAAMPRGEVLKFIRTANPSTIHLLGLTENEKNRQYLKAIKLTDPNVRVTVDGTWHRGKVGQGRPITEERKRILEDTMDDTELAAALWVDEWEPEGKPLKVLSEIVGIPAKEISKAARTGKLGELLDQKPYASELFMLHIRKFWDVVGGPDATRVATENVSQGLAASRPEGAPPVAPKHPDKEDFAAAEKEGMAKRDLLKEWWDGMDEWRKDLAKWEAEYPAKKPMLFRSGALLYLITPDPKGGYRYTVFRELEPGRPLPADAEEGRPWALSHQEFKTRLEALNDLSAHAVWDPMTMFASKPRADAEEWVKAAAIRTPEGKVFEGPMHIMAVVKYMEDEGVEDVMAFMEENTYEEGFTTNKGRFIDRVEAFDLATEAGQKPTQYAFNRQREKAMDSMSLRASKPGEGADKPKADKAYRKLWEKQLAALRLRAPKKSFTQHESSQMYSLQKLLAALDAREITVPIDKIVDFTSMELETFSKEAIEKEKKMFNALAQSGYYFPELKEKADKVWLRTLGRLLEAEKGNSKPFNDRDASGQVSLFMSKPAPLEDPHMEAGEWSEFGAISSFGVPIEKDATADYAGKVVSAPKSIESMVGIIKAMGKELPIRTGRISQKWAAGIFKVFPEVVRLQQANDVAVAAHEVGHALQKAVYGAVKARGFGALPSMVQTELIKLGRALYGTRKPVGGYTSEGFAELVRLYLTTENAPTAAPVAHDYFFNQIFPAMPELNKAILASKAVLDQYRKQGVANMLDASIKDPTTLKARLAKLGANFTREELFRDWVDEFEPLRSLAAQVKAKIGRQLGEEENPYAIASYRRGSAANVVKYWLEHGMTDFVGHTTTQPLAETLAMVRGREEEFVRFLWAVRSLERWGVDPYTGRRNGLKPRNPGMSKEVAWEIFHQYPHGDKFHLAAEGVWNWSRGVMKYVAQSSPSLAPTIDKILAKSNYYLPLARYIDPTQAKTSALGPSHPLNYMHGSGRQILPPLQQLVANAVNLASLAHKRQVLDAVLRLRNVEGMGFRIEEVPRPQVPNEVEFKKLREQLREKLENLGLDADDLDKIDDAEVLTYFTPMAFPKGTDPVISHTQPERRKDGSVQMKTRWYFVDPRLYDVLQGIDPYRLPAAADLVLGKPARLFRAGTTGLRASFAMFTNPARDLSTFLLQTKGKNAPKMLARWVVALGALANPKRLTGQQSEWINISERLGLQVGQPLGADLATAKSAMNRLHHGMLKRVVTSPLNALRELFSVTEAGPRLAEMMEMAASVGWKPGQPMTMRQSIAMGLAYKQVTIDFAAAGRIGKVFNQAIPFFNAAIQGARLFTRTLRENPTAAIVKAVSLLTLPALYLWFKHKDDDWYKDMPWRERYLYFNIPTGNGKLLQIPRPVEWGNFFSVVPEAILQAIHEEDPEAAKEAFWHLVGTTNPLDLPVAARVVKEQLQNKIDFFDRPIVPRGEVDLPPGEQRGPYTSMIAQWMGDTFPDLDFLGLGSPRRVDHMIRGFTGGALAEAEHDLSTALQAVGGREGNRDLEMSDLPVIGKAFRKGGEEGTGSLALDKFYDAYQESRARASSRQLTELPQDRQRRLTLDDARKAIVTLTAIRNSTRNLEKRQAVQRRIRQVAEEAIKIAPKASEMTRIPYANLPPKSTKRPSAPVPRPNPWKAITDPRMLVEF